MAAKDVDGAAGWTWRSAAAPSRVRVYLGRDVAGAAEPASTWFDPFGGPTLNGVFVG